MAEPARALASGHVPGLPGLGAWTVHTDVFDGPLDLLLHLVKRDGIDLKHLPIARVCDAYLDFLERLRQVDLNVASEYLVMAATLCHLKSLDLLPRKPTAIAETEEEEEDPRERFARRLEEYDLLRRRAEALDRQPMIGRDTFVRAQGLPNAAEVLDPTVDAFGLLEIYHAILIRADEPDAVVRFGESGPDFATCARFVLDALGGPGGTEELGMILGRWQRRIERVLTFLAVLEMARLGWIGLDQRAHLGPVTVVAKVASDVDLSQLTTWVEKRDAPPPEDDA
jgi:segregation and condensation protein A